jgi:hypothetical protein
MMKIAQRFCQGCPKMSGFALDEDSGMWVCGGCGLPYEMYYLARRAEQDEDEPVRYARGWDREDHHAELLERYSRPTSQRTRARSQD